MHKHTVKELETLREGYLKLLDEGHNEQMYQVFLETNTEFIPRLFLLNHDIHHSLVLRKLSLASDYTTDFFYISKSSGEWNCVLVEIEKPQSKYFKPGTLDYHNDFLAGLSQISRWRAWFDDDHNRAGFTHGTIRTLREGSLFNNKCNIKYVMVMGRRAELEDSPARIRLVRAMEKDDFNIISYDSLGEALFRRFPLYLGVRKNENYEIRSKEFLSEAPFVYIKPEMLRINKELRESIIANRDNWRFMDKKSKNPFDYALDRILPEILNY